MIVESFYSHLVADAGVAALVSGRIYPLIAPEGANAPRLTFEMDADDRMPLLSAVKDSLPRARFEVNAWALTHVESHTLAVAVEAALESTGGDFGTLSPPDYVDNVRMVSKFDIFEPATGLYRVRMQFIIHYR